MRWVVAVGHKHTEEKQRESRQSCRYKRKTPRPPNRGVGADGTIPTPPMTIMSVWEGSASIGVFRYIARVSDNRREGRLASAGL